MKFLATLHSGDECQLRFQLIKLGLLVVQCFVLTPSFAKEAWLSLQRLHWPASQMSESWENQKDRGGYIALKLLSWLGLRLGRGFARLLCIPIAAWFTLTAGQPKRASRQFLERALGRPVDWRDFFRHFYCFAQVSVDRFHFLAGRSDRFELEFHGAEPLLQCREQGQGCILLVSHAGNGNT